MKKRAIFDYIFSFGDVGYVRVASTGHSSPEKLQDMLQSISNVPVKVRVEPSRFAANEE